MAIKFKAPETKELRPRITVLGVGGGGEKNEQKDEG